MSRLLSSKFKPTFRLISTKAQLNERKVAGIQTIFQKQQGLKAICNYSKIKIDLPKLKALQKTSFSTFSAILIKQKYKVNSITYINFKNSYRTFNTLTGSSKLLALLKSIKQKRFKNSKNAHKSHILLVSVATVAIVVLLNSIDNKYIKQLDVPGFRLLQDILKNMLAFNDSALQCKNKLIKPECIESFDAEAAQVAAVLAQQKEDEESLSLWLNAIYGSFLPPNLIARLKSFINHTFTQICAVNSAVLIAIDDNVVEPVLILTRFFYLLALFTPVIVTVPLYFLHSYIHGLDSEHESIYTLWWYGFISRQMSRAGPTFIKLSQWAATRTDIFPSEFCNELSKFHSKNKPHSFSFTLQSIQETFKGIEVNTVFEWIEETPLGVGAIAQVHKAKFRSEFIEQLLAKSRKIMEKVNYDLEYTNLNQAVSSRKAVLENELEESNKKFPTSKPKRVDKMETLSSGSESSIDYTISYINSIFPLLISEKPSGNIDSNFWDRTRFEKLSKFLSEHKIVAIKILHPRVEKYITRDLKIISFFAQLVSLIPTLKWLSLGEEVNIFGDLMKSQLDLRIEAANLVLLDKNFQNRKNIDFPIPIVQLSSKSVLIETIASGIPLNTILENLPSPFGPETAKLGLDAFMRMLISDNFVHSDLHPGNIIVNLTPPPPLPKPLELASKLYNAVKRFSKGGSSDGIELQLQKHDGLLGLEEDGEYPTESQVSQRIQELSGDVDKSNTALKDYMVKLYSAGYKPRLTFLDSGLVTVLDKVSRRNFMDLFEAISSFDGYRAGQLMVSRSRSPEVVIDTGGFARKVQRLVSEIRDSSLSLSQVTASQILSETLDNARHHHVRIDPHFVNVAVAILILEGIGRQLDKNMDLLNSSLPILREYLRYEAQQSLKSVSKEKDTGASTTSASNSDSGIVANDEDAPTGDHMGFQYKLGFLKLWAYAEVKHYFGSVSNMLYNDNIEFFGEFSPFIEFLN